MATHCALFGTLLAVLIFAPIEAQRIRTGRCPAIRKREDCPTYVWDDCTCDLDCLDLKKCCFDGCRHACLEADTTKPSLRSKADVVFVMDSSGSIGPDDYNREKQFVKELINVFTISPTAARISTIIYSDNPKLVFDFETYQDKAGINAAIDNLEFLGNRTRIDKALALALQVFSRSRPSVPRIAFVLTDGKQTEDFDAKPLDVAARPLHELGVQVYVIGIGGHVDLDELDLIAKRAQDLFTVDSFERLLQQIYRIVNRFDTTDVAQPVDMTADMLFLLDSSSAVPQAQYGQEKEFLKNLVELFNVSPRYVRAGIIPYGSTAQLKVPFDRFTTNEAINRSIDELPYIGGKKRLDRALQVSNQAFSQARPLVPKIVVVLTHGGQLTEPGKDYIRNPIQFLRNAGVGIFVIAIGKDVDITGLKRLVKRPNDVISFEAHKDILPYLPSLTRYIFSKTDFSTPLGDNADVVFAIDTSDDVEMNDFKRQREFVSSLAKSFKISKYGARASVLTYGKLAYPFMRFNDFEDMDNFLFKMDRIREVNGPRRMDLALKRAARTFRDHSRTGPRIVLLFTAGPQLPAEADQLRVASKQLKSLGVKTYIIAIGPSVNLFELSGLVNSSNDILQISTFLDLQSEVHAVGRYVSGSLGRRRHFAVDVVFLMDSSVGVGIENYLREKEFIKAVSQALNHGERATRSSLVIYGDDPRPLTRFNTHKTLEEFKSVVDRAPYLRGTRRIDKALEYAAHALGDSRPDVPKIVVLLTSGTQSTAVGAKSLDVASKPLRALGAKTFIVAIGREPDIWELRPVVEELNDIFRVPSFLALPSRSNSFAQRVHSSSESTNFQKTNVDADVIFLVDSSHSITKEAFQKEKDFVRSVAKHFNVLAGKSRAAIISYGSSAFAVRQLGSRTEFEESVGSAPMIGGVRRIDRALQNGARQIYSARPSVPKILVLLTAGKQPPGSPSLETSARLLRSLGARPFAIAIGGEPDEKELGSLVERPEDVFKIPSFNMLPAAASSLAKEIEENLQQVKPITNVDVDVIFLMDSSQTVTQEDYRREKSSIKSMARHLNVSPDKSRAALISYGSSASVVRLLDSKDILYKSLNEAPLVGGGRRMDRALQEAAQLLSSARPSVPKLIVLLTSGKQPPESPSLESAGELLRSLGGRLLVIAIGREPDERKLGKSVERPEDVLHVASFKELEESADILAKGIENNLLLVSPTTNVDADVLFVMDSSQAVTQDDYGKQKTFIKSIAKHLNVSPGRSRGALVSYGSAASVVRQFSGGSIAFDESVDIASFNGGGGRLDRALHEAAGLLSSARSSIPKVVVLLTAGTLPIGSPSPEFAGRLVRAAGGRPFVVSIGREPDKRELRKVVERPEDVFEVESFSELGTYASSLAKKIEKRQRQVPEDFQADVLFIMDSSSEVTRDEYLKEKDFVASLADSLNLSPGRTRGAVLTYGFISTLGANFDSYSSFPLFKNAIDRTTYIGGSRRIDKALDQASQILPSARPLLPKIVVLITSGRQSREPGLKSLELAAKPLHEQGGKTFAVAISDRPDLTELRTIVKDETFIVSVPTFDDLGQKTPTFANQLADSSVPDEPTDLEADFLFIIDSSLTVSRDDYGQEKALVKSLIRNFEVPHTKSRIALITYGTNPRVVFRFDAAKSVEELERAIDNIPPIGGGRRIDRALDEAVLIMKDARQSVPKIVLLITAGEQTEGTGVQPLNLPARTLHETGSRPYVLEVGGRANTQELLPVVKNGEDVFSIGKFEDWVLISRRLASLIARNVGVPEDFQADVVFVIDSSSDVTRDNYNDEKNAVKLMTQHLKVSPGKSRAALITYGSTPSRIVKFKNYKTVSTLERAIDRAPHVGGRRRMELALEDAGNLLLEARPSARRIVVLFTSGLEGLSSEGLREAANRIYEERGELYIVAIGGRPDFQRLEGVVKKPEYVFKVPSFDELRGKSGLIARRMTAQNPVEDFVGDFVFLLDSSITVDQDTFNRQKGFIKSMVRSLNVSPGTSRAAAATYGDRPVEIALLSNFKDAKTFENSVDRAVYVAGRRRIDRALEFASILLNHARPSVPRVVVLLTTGKQAPDSTAPSLMDASQSLRDHGAYSYVVAVGNDPDQEELTPIIENPPDIFAVQSSEELTISSQFISGEIIRRTRLKGEVKPLDMDADVLFIVDSSFEVGRKNYKTEKDFVKSLAYTFNLERGKTRVAVVIYSTTASLVIGFTDHTSYESFASAVDSLPFLGRTRQLAEALSAAGSALKSARTSSPTIVVLLTAGKQTPAIETRPLDKEIESLRKRGTRAFVVAIGEQPDKRELTSIVMDPTDIFVVPSFKMMMRNSRPIAEVIANRTEVPPLPEFYGDVIFLVDSSSPLSTENFSKEKQFINALANVLGVPSETSRAAVILYDVFPRTAIGLDSARDYATFVRAVDSLTQLQGRRRMDRALEAASRIVQPGRPTVVILVTAGKQTNDLDATALRTAVQPLNRLGAKTFVVAIGAKSLVSEVEPAVRYVEDVFLVPDFDGLHSIVRPIASHIGSKQVPTSKPPVPSMDIIFLVDSSREVTSENYKKLMDFVATLAEKLLFGLGETRVSVILYSSYARLAFRFDVFKTPESLRAGLDGLPQLRRLRRIDRALDSAARALADSQPNVRKVVILITSGKQTQEHGARSLLDATKPLKAVNAERFVVSIGREPDIDELKEVVERSEDVLPVPSFDGLKLQTSAIAEHIAKVSKPHVKFAGDVVFLVDSSSDVSPLNFGREKDFAKSVAKILNIDQNVSRAAILSYGDRQHLSLFDWEDDVLSALDKTPYTGGTRRMELALLKAAEILEGGRFSVPKVVILFTAGVNGPDRDVLPLINASQEVRDIGANLYVVAIGSAANREGLEPLVENERDIYEVPTFDGLQAESEPVARDIGRRARVLPEKVYDVVADVVILVDSSFGVGEKNVEIEKGFVKNAAYSLNLAPDRSRISVILYSTYPQLPITFNDHSTPLSFERAVDRLPYVGNPRRIDRALDAAVAVMRGGRPKVAKVVILLVAGNQVRDPGAKPLSEIASSLNALKAKTFIVAIGQETDVRKLIPMVASNKDLFAVPSFYAVEPKTRPIIKHIAGNIEIPTVQKFDFKADIVFLLDSSFGVSIDDFQTEKEFVKSLSTALNLSPEGSRVAVLLYSTYTRIAVRLGILQTPETLGSSLDGLSRLAGIRRIDRALQAASGSFDNSKPGNEKVVVLLAAGRQSGGKTLKDSVQSLRTIGAKTYVIAIGSQVSLPELTPVVERHNDVIQVPAFDELVPRTDSIANQIANRNESAISDAYEADIVFIADSSGRVSVRDFELLKGFVKTMARLMNVSPQRSRAAFISYGDTPTMVIRFNGYRSLSQFDSSVENAPYNGGQRRIDLALDDARRLLSETRQSVPKVVVLFTGGSQSHGLDVKRLNKSARQLREYGAKTFVVAIGRERDADELKPIINDPQDIFKVQSFGVLKSKATSIASDIVKKTGEQWKESKAEEQVNGTVDVLFLLDGSVGINSENFNYQKDFIPKLASSLYIRRGKSRAAVVTYGGYVHPMNVMIFKHRTPEELATGMKQFYPVKGARRMDEALDFAWRMFDLYPSNASKVVLLLTGGKQDHVLGAKSLKDAVRPLRRRGAKTFVVTIGSDPDKEELRPIVDEEADIFPIPSFSNMGALTETIAGQIANRLVSKPPLKFPVDVVFLIDSSSGVILDNFEKEKEFVKSVTEIFSVDQHISRAAIISYGDRPLQYVSLDSSKADFPSAVNRAQYVGGRRRMDRAFLKSADILEGARFSVPKVVVLLTAGVNDPDIDSIRLVNDSQALRDAGVNLYIVAIGDGLDKDDLEGVVEKDDIFEVTSFGGLQGKSYFIAKDIASRAQLLPEKVYDVVADIVFLVDSSFDVGKKNLEIEKEFVKNVAYSLNLTPDGSRVSVVVYSSYPQLPIRFDDYRVSSEFEKAVGNIPYIGNTRRIDRALDAAIAVLRDGSSRVPKAVIFLTAGNQAKESGSKSLLELASSLNTLKAKTFVIVIGQEPDGDLSRIVTSNKDLFAFPSFKAMEPETREIIKHIAENIEEPTTEKFDLNADIIFLIDSSFSVTTEEYKKEKEFVKSLSTVLNLAPKGSRVAILLYSSYARIAMRLGILETPEALGSSLDGLSRIVGIRRIDRALETSSMVFDDTRPGNEKIVILLTAGRQSPGGKPLKDAVQPLRSIGAKVYVVAIGNRVSVRELIPVVRNSEDVIQVSSFDDLVPKKGAIARHIADKNETAVSDTYEADVVFIMDSSRGVSPMGFELEKGFIKKLARMMNVSPKKSRAAFISFGSAPTLVMRFSGYSSVSQFDRAVDHAPYSDGPRRMDLALEDAGRLLFEARPSVTKIVVLLAAGRQSREASLKPLNEAARQLRKYGAKTFVVAIGTEPDATELKPIVEEPQDLFEVRTFESLKSEANTIANSIVTRTIFPAPNPEDIAADVIFLIDSSTSVTSKNFKLKKSFVKSLARSLSVSPDMSRASVIVYGSKPNVVLSLDEFTNTHSFERAVDQASFISGSQRMDLALEAAAGVMKKGSRNVPKILVLVTAGPQSSVGDPKILNDAMESLRSLGTRTYVVAIGNQPNKPMLIDLVEDSKDIFETPSFVELEPQTAAIAKTIAEKSRPKPENITADVVFLVDTSSSIGQQNFNQEKRFVTSLARSLNIPSWNSRVAVVSYSETAITLTKLSEEKSKDKFDTVVHKMTLMTGRSRVDKALDSAFSLFSEGRPGVVKIAILLTAGQQSETIDYGLLKSSLQSLIHIGARTFVVAIGNRSDVQELESTVEKPNDMFKVKEFDELQSRVPEIAKDIAASSGDREVEDVAADIVFLLDSSASITQDGFFKEKASVKLLAKSLNVAPGFSRAAVVLFGSIPVTAITFNGYRTLNEFNNLIDKVSSTGGSRRMDRALEVATNLLTEGSRRTPKLVVLITSGNQIPSFGSVPLEIAVESLKRIGAKTFFAGIGRDLDVSELISAAEDPGDVFAVPSFNELRENVPRIAKHVTNRITPKPQDITADVVFLIDSSTSVGQDGFEKEKRFVKSLARALNISPGTSRAAVIAYSSTSRTVAKFTAYQTAKDFNEILSKSTFLGGPRRIDQALEAAETLMSEARVNVPRVVILITAGKQADAKPLDSGAKSLKDIKVRTFVVAIGREPDLKELKPVVDEAEDIFAVPSFDYLRPEVQPIAKHVSESLDISPEGKGYPHVIFLLDSSSSVQTDQFHKEKDFIKTLAKSLNVGKPGNTKAALISYGNQSSIGFSFHDHSTLQDFDTGVDKIRALQGSRRIDRALYAAAMTFEQINSSSPKIAVLLATGRQAQEPDTVSLGVAVQPLKDMDTKIYVVAVSSEPSTLELKPLVSKLHDVFRVPSYDDLKSEEPRVAYHIIKETPLLTGAFNVEVLFVMDSSALVSKEDYQRQRDFVINLARSLNLSPTNSKAAVLTYGDIPLVVMDLYDYSMPEFESIIDQSRYVGGAGRIDKAFREALNVFATSKTSVPKIAIFLTAGTLPSGQSVSSLHLAAQDLRRLNVQRLVIAVGSLPDKEDLKVVVDDHGELMTTSSFDDLQGLVQSVINQIFPEPIPRADPNDDIVFLMDSSFDVTQQDYFQQKRFVKFLARELRVSPSGNQAAVIAYGKIDYTAVRFGSFSTLTAFDSAVDSAIYVGGARRIDRALEAAGNMISTRSPTALKKIILLTGGRTSVKPGSDDLGRSVKILRDLEAKIYIIAFGKFHNTQNLRRVVRKPQDVHSVPDGSHLVSYVQSVGQHISSDSEPTPPPLTMSNEMVFVLDSSYDVTEEDYTKEKNFISSLLRNLNPSPDELRSALISYGDRASLVFRFTSFQNLSDFKNAVFSASYVGGERRIQKALDMVVRVVNEANHIVPKVVVFLTAGAQATGFKLSSTAAERFRNLGAKTFVIAIGQGANIPELKSLVEFENDIFSVLSFADLDSQTAMVSEHIKQSTGTLKPRVIVGDVVFLLDSSDGVTPVNFKKEKEFVKSFAKRLNASSGKVRAAVVAYSSYSRLAFDLNGYDSLSEFERLVDEVAHVGGTRRMDKALHEAANVLKYSHTFRPKFVFLLTAGSQLVDLQSLVESVEPLHKIDATVYVVSIGRVPDRHALEEVAGDLRHIHQVTSFDELEDVLPAITRKMVKGKQPPLINNADLIFLLDSSDDVPPAVFEQEKEFIKSMARKFRIAVNRTRFAVIRYSSFASSVIRFDSYRNVLDLVKGIGQIQYYGGKRRMAAAVTEAYRMLESSRSDVTTYIIVLTAGREDKLYESKALEKAAQPLLDSQTPVFVIGIGSEPDITELRLITERDSDIFMVPSSDLQHQSQLLYIHMASQTGHLSLSDFKADVLFLVDSSQRVGKEKFELEKEFVKALARTFDLSRDNSRTSVVTFGDTPKISIRFEDYSNIQSFLRGTDVVPFEGGAKRLDKVLIFAARILSKGRPHAHKIAVLVTDGKQTTGADELGVSAKLLHQLGVSVFVVGAGENADMRELGKIASKPDDLFVSRSFDELPWKVPALVAHMSGTGTLNLAHALFLIDSSGDRSTVEFETQIDFTKSIAKRLNVSPTGTRAGVILYNGNPQLTIRFDEYDTLSELYTLLDDLPLRGGRRELDKALLLASETLQASPQVVPKYVLVLVEGQQLTSSGIRSLAEAARPLHALGVTVYVVGIGASLNMKELLAMVHSPEYIITVPRFAELLRKVDSIAQHIGFTGTAPCKETLDIGILMDSSGSMGVDNFSREKNFVKLISRRLTSFSANSRIGLIVFSDYPRLIVSFRDFERLGIDGFKSQVDELPYQGGRSRIDLSLLSASQEFYSDGRTGVPRVLILITDGRQSIDPGYTPLGLAVKPLQAQRVKILAVGIGKSIDKKELTSLTGNADDVLTVETFEEIDRLQRQLVSKTCQVRN